MLSDFDGAQLAVRLTQRLYWTVQWTHTCASVSQKYVGSNKKSQQSIAFIAGKKEKKKNDNKIPNLISNEIQWNEKKIHTNPIIKFKAFPLYIGIELEVRRRRKTPPELTDKRQRIVTNNKQIVHRSP